MGSFLVFVAVCALLAVGVKVSYKSVLKTAYPIKYSEYVEEYSSCYGIDKKLLYSVIKTESGFDPSSVSSAGARGLTQITEDTFDWLRNKTGEDYSFDDLYSPEISIKYGAYFLSILMEEYGETKTAIAAYHAGMGNVTSWLGNTEYSSDGVNLDTIPIPETSHYVNKVTKAMDIYTELYNL